MAKAQSPLQQKIRAKQRLFLGVGGLILIALALSSAWMMQEKGPETTAPNTTTKNIFESTTDLVDREKWRSKAAEDIELMRQRSAEQQRTLDELNRRLESLANKPADGKLPEKDAGLPAGIVPPPEAPPPLKTGQATANLNPAALLGGPGMAKPVLMPGQITPKELETAPQGILGAGIATVPFGPPKPKAEPATVSPQVKTAPPSATSQGAGEPPSKVRTSGAGYRQYVPDAPLIPNRAGGEGAETYIPAGTFARVVIVGGIDAPTGGQAQSRPHPFLLRVVGDMRLPNGVRLDMNDCVITGNAYGDLADERAHMRTDRLSCVHGDGGVIDVAVTGHVNGEDGKSGLRGRVVTKAGAVLGNALFTSTLAALGSATRESSLQTISTGLGSISQVRPGSEMRAALGEGFGRSFEKLSDYYMNMAEKRFPVIEIDSMRVVDVVLDLGISIEKGS